MKKTSVFILVAVLIIVMILVACTDNTKLEDKNIDLNNSKLEDTNIDLDNNKVEDTNIIAEKSTGQIYLYGERHGIKSIMEKELDLWDEYYINEDMRHLFIESSYYAGEFLNLWMKSDSDQILEELYEDWKGTQSHNPDVKEFYEKIKNNYPETIFHGTDLGHQYNTTGKRFLDYLKANNLEDTDKYLLTEEAIEQGKFFYDNSDDAYRENKMTENFIREFDKLQNKNVMGIYGGAHTDFETMDYNTKTVPSMANQLKKRYGDAIDSEELGLLAEEREVLSSDIIIVESKEYEALYFGKQEMGGFRGNDSREFWRLENAYEDLKGHEKVGNVLPYNNYPMEIEREQVFVIDYTKTDGSVVRQYFRSDGLVWNGMDTTEEFEVE